MSQADTTFSTLLLLFTSPHVLVCICGLLSLLSRHHQDFNSPFTKHLSPSTTARHPPLPPSDSSRLWQAYAVTCGLILPQNTMYSWPWDEKRRASASTGQLLHEVAKVGSFIWLTTAGPVVAGETGPQGHVSHLQPNEYPPCPQNWS